MTYTLTIHPDGTHISTYHEAGALDRQVLGDLVGGEIYVEALADDADIVTSNTARGKGRVNPFATALAWAFGKIQLRYYGDVIITGGTDRRGHFHGLRQPQLDALTDALTTLRNRSDRGFPIQLIGGDFQVLRHFETPDLDPVEGSADEDSENNESGSKKGVLVALCIAAGLFLGAPLGWLVASANSDEVVHVVTEDAEPGAEEEAGVTADELNQIADDLAERESEIASYEEQMEDLDQLAAELEERAEGLDDRESDVGQRESLADDREGDISTAEDELDEREAALDEREEQLDEREASLDDEEDEDESPEPTEDIEGNADSQ